MRNALVMVMVLMGCAADETVEPQIAPDAATVEPMECGPVPTPPGDLTPVSATPELVTFTAAQHERITRFVDQATGWIGCTSR